MLLVDNHPDGELLRAYGAGLLKPDQHATVESHVLECDSCWRTLSELPQDSFISLIRSSWQSEQAVTRPGRAARPNTAFVDELPAALADHPRYILLGPCGTGGMGVVYRAEHRLMGREVAIKIIRPDLLQRPCAVERFRREVRAAASLAHPNVVPAYDAEEAEGVHFLAMEFVTGFNLAEFVARNGPLPVSDACDYVRQAALGLAHAHARGMVHRDIKPQNLMLTPEGQVKILDFGLSKFASEAAADHSSAVPTLLAVSDLTRASTTLGTPDYVAPEQAMNPGAADIRADIYAIGATLYFLLAGRPPFVGRGMIERLQGSGPLEPQPLAELRQDVPPELIAVLRRMLAQDPIERFQTPTEVVEALDSLRATGEEADDERVRRIWRSKTFVVAGVLGLLLIALAAVVRYATPAEGTITIDTDSVDVRVIVEGQNRPPVMLDSISRREMVFAAGEYTVRLAGNANGLAIVKPAGGNFSLRRGETEVIRVQRIGPDRRVDPLVELRSLGARISRTPSGAIVVDIRSTPVFTDEKVRLIAELPNVADVTLESVPVTDAGLEGLRPLTNLQRLILNDSDVGGRVLERLTELPLRRTVTSLGLRGLPIDDSDLAFLYRFSQLYKIDLSGTKVTDEGLKHFVGTRVRMIDAEKTRVSPEGAARLREAMPEVEIAL